MRTLKIGNFLVGEGQPTFVVAEIGINGNGSMEMTKNLIDIAVSAGCQAVKFQKRTIPVVFSAEELAKPRAVDPTILKNAIKRGVLSDEVVQRLKTSDEATNGDLKWALEYTQGEYAEINDHCAKQNIMWFASCWDEGAVDFIEQFQPPCYKIASPSLTDDNLLAHTARKGRPVILSTGMANLVMVRHAFGVLEKNGANGIVLLHCVSHYTAETNEKVLKRINLNAMATLRLEFGVPVGLSSHHNGRVPTFAAVAMGADMVEHHITLNKGYAGSDQGFSLNYQELTELCRWIGEYRLTRGNGEITIDESEIAAMKKLRRVWSPEQNQLFESRES